MGEISDKTIEAWFRPRCRCAACGVVATLGDLETCDCGSHIWRHDCPETGESYIEHSIEFHRDQIQAELTHLREAGTAIDAAFADRIAALEAALVQIMECPVNSGARQYSIARKALGLYPSDSDEDA